LFKLDEPKPMCMRIFLAVVFFISFTSLAYAQNDPKSKEFINEFMTTKYINDSTTMSEMFHVVSKKPKSVYEDITNGAAYYMREAMETNKNNVFYGVRKDSVIYIDSAGNRRNVSIRNSYKMHPLPGMARFQQIIADSIVMTQKERTYINAEIDKMEKHTWQEGLLLNIPLISADSVKKVFDRRKIDKMFDGWRYFGDNGVDRIYNFGVPIFFRNDTYCLFYYGYSCGSLCGEGKVTIYKKVKGKWEAWSTWFEWVS